MDKQMTIEDFGVKIPKVEHDAVHNPNHYTQGNISCIEAMVEAFGIEFVQHFCIGNAFKYVWRFLYKNGAEDVEKAANYLNIWTDLERRRVHEEVCKL